MSSPPLHAAAGETPVGDALGWSCIARLGGLECPFKLHYSMKADPLPLSHDLSPAHGAFHGVNTECLSRHCHIFWSDSSLWMTTDNRFTTPLSKKVLRYKHYVMLCTLVLVLILFKVFCTSLKACKTSFTRNNNGTKDVNVCTLQEFMPWWHHPTAFLVDSLELILSHTRRSSLFRTWTESYMGEFYHHASLRCTFMVLFWLVCSIFLCLSFRVF